MARHPGGGDGGDGGDGGKPPDDGDAGGGGRRRPGGGGGRSISQAQNEVQASATAGRPGAGRAPDGPGSTRPDAQSGPPWRVADGVPGLGHVDELLPPHARHTVSGARSGEIKADNTVILRGHEAEVRADVQAIAEGRARFNDQTSRFEINGRSYGVEDTGRVYPDSGPGLVKLDRNEYAALQQWAKAGGDLSKAPQLERNPRFTNNPDAVRKAKDIYDGTYQ